VHTVGVEYLVPIDCSIKKAYTFNNKFEVEVGDEFFGPDGLLFPPGFEKLDMMGKTYFGWYIYCPSVIYARSDHNMVKALTRQTCKRDPDNLGYDELLTGKQRAYCQLATTRMSLEPIRDYLTFLVRELVDYRSLVEGYANMPHSKRAERLSALLEIMDDSSYFDATFVRDVEGKIKIQELGKFKKYPRLFLTLGPKSIFKIGFLIDFVKMAFNAIDDPLYHFEFVKSPVYKTLERVFNCLVEPQDMYFCYFSDDSSVAIRCDDGSVFRANVDISSCDGSHTGEIFNILQFIASGDPRLSLAMRAAIAQCRKSMVLKSYTKVKESKLKLRPIDPVLYTGSTLTTVVNNLANRLIANRIKELIKGQRPKFSDCRLLVIGAAEDCGYIVTMDVCDCVEQLQFLKHSPVWTGEKWIPILNLGVILRIFGSCWGDLPGTSKEGFARRAYAWNRQLVQSLVHAGDHPLTNMLRSKYAVGSSVSSRTKGIIKRLIEKEVEFKFTKGESTYHFVTAANVMKRYSLPGGQLQSLCSMIHDCKDGGGECINLPITQAILSKDYGYEFPE